MATYREDIIDRVSNASIGTGDHILFSSLWEEPVDFIFLLFLPIRPFITHAYCVPYLHLVEVFPGFFSVLSIIMRICTLTFGPVD